MPRRLPTHKPPRARLSDGRATRTARGYDADWQAFRAVYLRAHPVCAACGCLSACHVDHIQTLRSGAAKYDESNLQALCHSCHSRKTVQHDGGFGR